MLLEYGRTPDAETRFLHWPSMTVLEPPVPPDDSTQPRPFFLPDGRIGWWSTGGLQDDAGSLLLALDPSLVPGIRAANALVSDDGKRLALVWGGGDPWEGRWTLFERDDDGSYGAIQTLAPPHDGAVSRWVPPSLRLQSWVSEEQVLLHAGPTADTFGMGDGDPRRIVGVGPVVMNFATGELTGIAGFHELLGGRANCVIGFELQ